MKTGTHRQQQHALVVAAVALLRDKDHDAWARAAELLKSVVHHHPFHQCLTEIDLSVRLNKELREEQERLRGRMRQAREELMKERSQALAECERLLALAALAPETFD